MEIGADEIPIAREGPDFEPGLTGGAGEDEDPIDGGVCFACSRAATAL